MPTHSYPDAVRLRELKRRCRDIILGVFDESDELLGAAVLLPITQSTLKRLELDQLKQGERLTADDLRVGWRVGRSGTDLYVSAVAAEPGKGAAVLRVAAAALPQILRNRTAFARTGTLEGRRAAEYLRFETYGDRGLWRRSPPERLAAWSSRSGRLARYDRAQATVTAFLRVTRPAVAALYVVALALCLAAILVPIRGLSALVTQLLAIPTASISPIMTTAATAGGLALTVFFFTAQSRLSGINQYGVTAMYRVRDLIPLVLLTTATVGCGTGFLLTRGTTQAAPVWAMLFAAIAIISQLALLLYIFLLSLGLIRGLDPVAIARQFARDIHGQDADEWGLVSVGTDLRGPLVTLNQRRVNFGLRDPLMPIHELVLVSTPQRYGQLLAVLAERISVAYGCRWEQQFPDSGDWNLYEPGGRYFRDIRQRAQIRVFTSDRLRRERLQLTMLILHYFRRIHRNGSLKVNKDMRRQAAQYVLARLMTVLARTKTLPGVDRLEITGVLNLCIDALLRIGADYSPGGTYEDIRPEVPKELLRGFVTAIDALDANGYADVAQNAAEALAWLFNSGAIDRSRVVDSAGESALPTLANQRLVRIATKEGNAAPPAFMANSPWEVAIPDRRVRAE